MKILWERGWHIPYLSLIKYLCILWTLTSVIPSLVFSIIFFLASLCSFSLAPLFCYSDFFFRISNPLPLPVWSNFSTAFCLGRQSFPTQLAYYFGLDFFLLNKYKVFPEKDFVFFFYVITDSFITITILHILFSFFNSVVEDNCKNWKSRTWSLFPQTH